MLQTESDPDNRELSGLVTAYRRSQNVQIILEAFFAAGINDIYVVLDAPKSGQPQAQAENQKVKEVITNFENRHGLLVQKQYAYSNQGCAVSVISGVDWAFTKAQNLIVLEDDCLPSPAFFDFVQNHLPHLRSKSQVEIICGTQFIPPYLTQGRSLLSHYALTWGWATSRQKWMELRKLFFDHPNKPTVRDLLSKDSEEAFWRAGARRARLGFTDVWDTILLEHLHDKKSYAIHPPANLIKNLGNDDASTHVSRSSVWTNREVQMEFLSEGNSPVFSENCDYWIKHYFYRIRTRHLFTTKITLVLDQILPRRRRKLGKVLAERLRT